MVVRRKGDPLPDLQLTDAMGSQKPEGFSWTQPLFGGFELGPNALLRFYVLHVVALPLVTAFLIGPLTQFVVIPFMTDGAGADAIGGEGSSLRPGGHGLPRGRRRVCGTRAGAGCRAS